MRDEERGGIFITSKSASRGIQKGNGREIRRRISRTV